MKCEFLVSLMNQKYEEIIQSREQEECPTQQKRLERKIEDIMCLAEEIGISTIDYREALVKR